MEQHMKNEEKLLNLLKDTYENYSVDFIKDALAEGMTYDNTLVLSQITSKQEYIDYLVPKLQVMKEKNTAFNFLMVYQEGQGRPHLIFTPKNQGAFGCFTIEEEGGLIKAIHLEPANFYLPLGYKDKSAFEKFVRHSNSSRENVIMALTGR